jgi:phosphohistidine swiveling domain-containing protein
MARFVEFFDCDRPEPTRLGGKGASLCRLVQNHYRVPTGFVVTVDAFAETCAALGLRPALESLSAALASPGDDPLAGGHEVARRLETGRIPATILRPIQEAVAALELWDAGGIIVRSSATVEDSAGHSFAGIFDSIPITFPDALEPAIRAVWASVFSPRALSYFREIGLRQLPKMAVVIQRFIRAERSGVMFTSFASRTLVEHVEGDCEKLVKGEVTPEQLWIDRGGSVLTAAGSLQLRHAKELARLSHTLERSFGGPQDVEWVLYDGEVHLVQSRPITTGTMVDAAVTVARAGAEDPVLTGTPASGGIGTGEVHLVFNIEDALVMDSGRVLVTPMTNPDMVVAMRKSAGIVTDVGGMICHAAIVSRELGLPCVVGTGAATTTLAPAELVTVSGSTGAVYRGTPGIELRAPAGRPGTWADVWAVWTQATADRPDLVPLVSSVDALETMPPSIDAVVWAPDIDLRTGTTGLWVEFEALAPAERDAWLDAHMGRVTRLAQERPISRVHVLPIGRLAAGPIAEAVRRAGGPLLFHPADPAAPRVILDPDGDLPRGAVIPLAAAALYGSKQSRPQVGGMDAAKLAATDTIKFFGHRPGSHHSGMPDPARRRGWWALLPEYGRFHQEFGSPAQGGDHTWLEVRPELVISALLKSLVQPGFEMVPRVLGFRELPPMHIKWMRCRYHFRADTFAQTWEAIVRGTWDGSFMADLMRRVRASYDHLAEVLALFPGVDEELAWLPPERIIALITAWWPRWVEFFALCWFIQAQGDDILYPFIDETVSDNLARLAARADDFAWPGVPELMAPTTPVLSAEYMASMAQVREQLLTAGLTSTADALAALAHGEHPGLSRCISRHLERWHWMRDRDLLFEPWDTPARVIETALKTDPHPAVPYEANLRRNRFALSVHFDLAHAAGRADGLNHAARLLHDLNVERENHHVLWLKFSYPLRRLFLELERRLIMAGSLAPGDVFFLQAPELIKAARRLPEDLPRELVARVKNRRRGYEHEARLVRVEEGGLIREDDYF